jgi:hypothetical protein
LDQPDIRYLASPDIRQGNLVSGRIPDIKKAGLSGRISGASLLMGLWRHEIGGYELMPVDECQDVEHGGHIGMVMTASFL